MSRSNPTANNPHPCQRWIEWDGAHGGLRHYDKEAKKNVPIDTPFTFMLLDQLAAVKGWHDQSESGIYSNEVRDTREQPFIVKAFKGGVLAEGFYANIKDRVGNVGGHYVTNLYVAFKDGDALRIGSIQFKGSALSAWMDFSKENRKDVYKQAVCVTGSKAGKKGQVSFQTPIFQMKTVTAETDSQAAELDRELQGYLKTYFSRKTTERVEPEDQSQEIEDTPDLSNDTTFDPAEEAPF